MSALLAQLRIFGIIAVIIIIALYVVTIIWVVRDAPRRGVSPVKWGVISLIPFFGALVYSALRPSMLLADKEEQELEYLLRQRELMRYGECGRCSYPVRDDYIVCPHCGSQLKNVCQTCGKPLDPHWSVCPWCCTKVMGKARRSQRAHSHAAAGEHGHLHADAGYDGATHADSRHNQDNQRTEVMF